MFEGVHPDVSIYLDMVRYLGMYVYPNTCLESFIGEEYKVILVYLEFGLLT